MQIKAYHHQVFVAEGEPAMFECRVEPKHDLNLSVRWYRNDEELVGLIDNDECTKDERINTAPWTASAKITTTKKLAVPSVCLEQLLIRSISVLFFLRYSSHVHHLGVWGSPEDQP